MLFPKRLVYTLQDLWYLFYILSKTDRSEVQIDSKEGYLTLWCHQPHPGQSLNPQTVVEFRDHEVESVWIFQRVLSLVVQKHSYKLDYQDKSLVLKGRWPILHNGMHYTESTTGCWPIPYHGKH